MAFDAYDAFLAVEAPIRVFKGKPIVNTVFVYANDDDTAYDFSGQVGYGLRVWDGRAKNKLLYEWTQGSGLTLVSSSIYWSASTTEMNFQLGKMYYEAYSLNSGGYEIVLRYGDFIVI